MKTYIKPALKVLRLDAEEILENGFIHQSIGNGNQLSKEIYLDDEVGQDYTLPHVRSVWEEE